MYDTSDRVDFIEKQRAIALIMSSCRDAGIGLGALIDATLSVAAWASKELECESTTFIELAADAWVSAEVQVIATGGSGNN